MIEIIKSGRFTKYRVNDVELRRISMFSVTATILFIAAIALSSIARPWGAAIVACVSPLVFLAVLFIASIVYSAWCIHRAEGEAAR